MALPLILDIGMAEMVVIGVVALIVVGPKDLPGMFRTVGQFVGKARGMARDFQRAMEDAADDAGVGDLKKGFDQATSMKNLGLDSIKDATASVQDSVRKAADPLAEHAKRVKAVEDANKAADQWPPADMELPKDQPDELIAQAPLKIAADKKVGPKKKPTAKKPAAKKAASKTAAKKTPAKKATATKAAAKKAPAKKKPAKKTKT